MADNSSNSVAIVAIIIIVALAVGAFLYFTNKVDLSSNNQPTKVEVNLPEKAPAPAPAPSNNQ